MSELGLQGHASIAARGPLLTLDDTSVAFGCGSGVALFSTTGGRHDTIWPDGCRVTAVGSNPALGQLLVSSAPQRPPTISVLRVSDKTELVRLGGDGTGTQLEYSLLASSRNGTRVAAFGGATDDRLYVWDTVTGRLLPGAVATVATPCTAASFNPFNGDVLVASGTHGLYFWTITKTFDSYTLEAVKAEATPVARFGGATDGAPPQAAAAKNHWTCHAWAANGTCYAANAAGDLVLFDAATGRAVSTVAAAGGVVITSLVLTRGALVAGCEDGVVRWLSLEDASVQREVTLRPRLQSTEAASLPVASMAPSASFHKLFVLTAVGSLHALTLDTNDAADGKDGDDTDPDKVELLHEAHAEAVVGMAVLPRTAPSTPYVATIAADRRLRVWDYAKRRLVCHRRFLAAAGFAGAPPAGAAQGSSAAAPGDSADAPPTAGLAAGSGLAVDDSQAALLTTVAAHPRLPLLAVGSGDGFVRFVAVVPNPRSADADKDVLKALASAGAVAEQPAVVPTTLMSSWVHAGPVTAIAFCEAEGTPFVASVSAEERRLYVHDFRVPAPSEGGPDAVAKLGTHGFNIVARVDLPAGDRRQATSLFWRGTQGGEDPEVCVVLESGEMLSVPVPAAGLAPTVDGAPAMAEDLTARTRLRGRLHVSVTAMVRVSWGVGDFGYASSPSDKGLLVVGLGWKAGNASGGHSVAGTEQPPIQRVMPLASLPCHTKGVVCVAQSPVTPASKDAPVVLATGGADGAVAVIAVKGSDLLRRVSVNVHSSSVSGVAFTRDGRFVISTGLDGAVHVLAVSGQLLEAATGGRLLASGAASISHVDTPAGGEAATMAAYAACAGAVGPVATLGDDGSAHVDDGLGAELGAERVEEAAIGSEATLHPAHVRIEAAAEAAEAVEAAAAKDQTRARLDAIATKLEALLAANKNASDLERLDRDEFVVDVAGRDGIEAQYAARAEAARDRILTDSEKREIVIRRIVEQCWESMEVPATCVKAFLSDAVVHNFPIRKLTPEETFRLRRLVQLRRVEMLDLERHADASDGVWKGLLDDLPPRADWILNSGLLPPTLDPLHLKQAAEADKGDAAAGAGEEAEGDVEGEEEEDDAGEEEEAEDSDSFDMATVVKLLYHPAAVRTPNQRRTQTALLQILVREVQRKFNAAVHDLAMVKLDSMDKIDGKNKRIREIRTELEDDSPFFVPELDESEEPERVLTVTDDAITVEKYIPEEERARLEAEVRARAAADAANKDDAPLRALDDMMGGTLEAKDELSLLEQELVREEWMDQLSLEEMSDAQRAELEEFEAKQKAINDEKARHRKALQLELKKLKAEVKDICKSFDDQVATAFSNALTVQLYCHAQELTAVRLAMSVQEREESFRMDRQLEDRLAELLENEEVANQAYEDFAERTDAQEAHVADIQRRDREMERGVRESLKEAGGGGGSIDADTIRMLLQMYKRRTTSRDVLSRADPGAASTASLHQGPALDPYREATTVVPPSAVDLARTAAETALKPLSKLDCPEAFDPDTFPAAWARMNELRLAKIRNELELAAEQDTLADMRQNLDRLKASLISVRNDIDTTEQKRDDLLQAREVATANLELMICLKQGQDEMESEAVATDYSSAAMIPRGIVTSINADIVKLGTDRVDILTKIKDFRKSINFMEWEHRYLGAQATHHEEHYTDLHMLRVTKELQHFIKGGDMALKQRKDMDKLEAKVEHLKKAHTRTVSKIQRQADKLGAQVKERMVENTRLESRKRELEESVAMRESIKATRSSGAGTMDASSKKASAMKALVTRRKLVELARAQTEEIEFLRKELDRLRQRTFPSFAHIVESRGNVDERG